MRKKDNTTLLILAGVAIVGYFAFKKGGVLNQAPAQASLNTLRQQTTLPAASLQQIPGVASELPSLPDIGIIAPALDPTGMQITMY